MRESIRHVHKIFSYALIFNNSMLSLHRSSHRGFTLIELLVGITVFAIGITAIYLLLNSTLKSVSYSRHEIIVASLLREQLELARSVRDTNLSLYALWDRVPMSPVGTQTGFAEGMYTIENNFASATTQSDASGVIQSAPTVIERLNIPPTSKLTSETFFRGARLYLDDQWRYTHTETQNPTPYASYLIIHPLGSGSVEVVHEWRTQWYVFDARVIVQDGSSYREYDAKTVLTDWIR